METVEFLPDFGISDPEIVKSILNGFRKIENAFLLDRTYDDCISRFVWVSGITTNSAVEKGGAFD